MKGSNVKYTQADGMQAEVDLSLEIYSKAKEDNLTVTQKINRDHPTKSGSASAFEQMAASAGLFMRADNKLGISPPSMKDVVSGAAQAGEITRSGEGGGTPASRLLFPEVVMRSIESELRSSDDAFLAGVDDMIAITTSVAGARVEQPIINVTAPGETAAQPIAQLALPPKMVTITTSDQSYKIPTFSVGLEISEEALESSTLDLVGLALGANSREQSIVRAEQDIVSMITGDADLGEVAVAGGAASAFDATVNAGTPITQKAWVKFLHSEYRKRSLSHLIMTLDTALLVESRAGKPTSETDDPNSARIDALFSIQNLALPAPKVLLVEEGVVAANTVIGLDSRYGIRKTVNVNATYSAVEDFVLRKATGLRLDYGYVMKKLYPDAWTSMVLGA